MCVCRESEIERERQAWREKLEVMSMHDPDEFEVFFHITCSMQRCTPAPFI
jgi:hypothetical protein